jgi:uncharacterized membrane protein YgcG
VCVTCVCVCAQVAVHAEVNRYGAVVLRELDLREAAAAGGGGGGGGAGGGVAGAEAEADAGGEEFPPM